MNGASLLRNAAGAASPLAHGGRLDEARRLFPNAPHPWIDLSTGVNPHPYPLPNIPAEAFTRLPCAEALAALEAAAARAYRAPEHLDVVGGAGTQAFIQLLPQLVPARRVAVLDFTYGEHAANWRAGGALVVCVSNLDALEAFDVAVVVNPNNPDGRTVPPEKLAALAARMALRGGLLIVDEAFMDFTPEASITTLAPSQGLVVLRSFGKAYGLPGLRLGFALCPPSLAARLRLALGPWSVNGPALAVGAVALADAQWLSQSATSLAMCARRLDALLMDAGFDIVGGTSLFRLAASSRAGNWFARLGENGILTRRFTERDNWLRFGVPKSDSGWTRLTRVLERADER